MTEPRLIVIDRPDPLARQIIDDGLARFNAEQAGYWDYRPLDVLAVDPETREVLGGITGRTSLGLLFIDVVYLPESLRGSGLGSRILQVAEAEARQRGCCAAVLYTISFQAPGFYERHGYQVMGKVDCDPPGTSRIFMSKRFDEPAGGA